MVDCIFQTRYPHIYFTRLPDHSEPGFDESSHFDKFGKRNIVFNAESKDSQCDDHVGCLSIKTIVCGEETYFVEGRQITVRPGRYLVLNNDQRYGCRIRSREKVRCLSIFFREGGTISDRCQNRQLELISSI